MDTVKEENSTIEEEDEICSFLHVLDNPLHNTGNGINNASDDVNVSHYVQTNGSSRRTSAIIDALRRPSQAIALNIAHAVMNQRRYFLNLVRSDDAGNDDFNDEVDLEQAANKYSNKIGDDALTTILSTLYAKLLVVVGIAFSITEASASSFNLLLYQGFYLYLCCGSIAFVTYMYVTLVKEGKAFSIFNLYQTQKRRNNMHSDSICTQKSQHCGSLFLRSGAIAFGIGSMVYSGLKFGHYFKLTNNQECISSVLQAVVPVTRIILTLVQMQFIFFNSKDIELNRHKIVVRFGLMHMIATNLCEWLYVLIEETKHEIAHLAEHSNGSSFVHHKYCLNDYVMDSAVKNASKYLFPCSIEYSLICAVILYETWKKLNPYAGRNRTISRKKISAHFDFEPIIHHNSKSTHHISIDCSNVRRGLFAGILVIVLTIISLIMISVLNNEAATTEAIRRLNEKNTEFEVNIMELVLYIITTFTVSFAMYRMRELKYDRKIRGVSLNKTLLLVAQTGMFTYCIFSIIGCCFTLSYNSPAGLLTEVFSFIQASLQTLFVLDGWWRRFRNLEQTKRKPGRELVTFLIIANMAMWTINIVEKNRPEFRSSHLQFFGDLTWTIIIHISMPLVIFYRFQSTVCLYEIWKSTYEIKRKHSLSPYFSA